MLGAWRLSVVTAFCACAPAATDSGAVLPEDTGAPDRDTGEAFVPVDGGDTVLNEDPLHTLVIRQWGDADLAPAGGPYQSWVGALAVQEYVDGVVPDPELPSDPLDCDLSFALSGVPSESTCPGCAFVFDVQFSLVSGNPDGCHDPFLPAHGDTWVLGWREAESTIVRDFGGAGQWLPWYPGELLLTDVLTFEWTATTGFAVDPRMNP